MTRREGSAWTGGAAWPSGFAGELSPFNERPDVLVWGSRLFVVTGREVGTVEAGSVAVRRVYREAFTAALLSEMEHPARDPA